MPLVFTYDDLDVGYDDELGMTYDYPARYRPLIQPGAQFVYYESGRRADGTSEDAVYIGEGVVDTVSPIGERYRCTIADYRSFDAPVPAKPDGRYLEPEANRRKGAGLYFQIQVRQIERKTFDAICKAGSTATDRTATASKQAAAAKRKAAAAPGRKGPSRVEEMALKLGMAEAIKRWPSAIVFRAPAGSGFSIAIQRPTGEFHHLAVKGTLAREPSMRLSAPEIAFFQSQSASYSVWVFYAIDLEAGTGKLHRYEGRAIEVGVARQVAAHAARMRNGARVVRGRSRSRTT